MRQNYDKRTLRKMYDPRGPVDALVNMLFPVGWANDCRREASR
jgi:hypothetical protein